MKISIVTDEISSDIETALELGASWGVHDFELRGVDSGRVPNISAYELERTKEAIKAYGVRIVAVSPGLFKIPYPRGARGRFPVRTIDMSQYETSLAARELVAYHTQELIPASIEFALELGAGLIVAFSFERTQDAAEAPDEILVALDLAASQCSRAGLKLAIEVEEGHWADNGLNASKLVAAVANPALSVNWDPGNVIPSGEKPYPDGYQHVRGMVGHVHFKDARKEEGDLKFVIDGEVDWAGQIHALEEDGYEGYISVETHMWPKVQSARKAVDRLRSLLNVEAT